jgi:hypothetical protein
MVSKGLGLSFSDHCTIYYRFHLAQLRPMQTARHKPSLRHCASPDDDAAWDDGDVNVNDRNNDRVKRHTRRPAYPNLYVSRINVRDCAVRRAGAMDWVPGLKTGMQYLRCSLI